MRDRKWVALVCGVLALLTLPVGADARTATSTRDQKYAIAVPVLFGVLQEDIVPDFGAPRGGGTRTHEGQDIRAEKGTPVVTPVDGTVLKTGSAATPGKFVYVRGKDGHTYAYIHLDTIAKIRKGKKLKTGDLIGTLGETGNARGTVPHLHFEIMKGKPIDPMRRITKDFTLTERIEYLNRAFKTVKDDDALAELMVATYPGILYAAQSERLTLHPKLVSAQKKHEPEALALQSVELRRGDEGDAVRALQIALVSYGSGPRITELAYAGLTGYFGAKTEAALREFQTEHALGASGVFDEETHALIESLMRG